MKRLAGDSAAGREKILLPYTSRSGIEYAENFTYVATCVTSGGSQADFGDLFATGCDCEKECFDGCICGRDQHGLAHYHPVTRRLRTSRCSYVVRECGAGCSCASDCSSRLVQHGITIPLQLYQVEGKGWAVRCASDLPEGTFVCEYAGELLSTVESRARFVEYDRKGSNFLLVLREVMGSGSASLRINIDATYYGNAARFINHSCDGGNLQIELVRIGSNPLPRVAFFTSRGVPAYSELTFAYGDIPVPNVHKAHQSSNENGETNNTAGLSHAVCKCGTPACSGWLPRDESI
ncbi:hypothetical protein CYMTET_10050 [Cymbomonas tetramitiformis]|uniref:Uncharacterized protein n=1 Tax=Cymbomonas tetramitiformis TaxID=36881 RepID=A0AAE0LEJ5_9CHLO|nr:hypothetical protein CYMTET_10050 [Cymbomonas tetramitiformis]